MGYTDVDCVALRGAAHRFDAAAHVLDGMGLSRLGFDARVAGRAHTAHGEAVHAALGRLAAGVAQWSRAAAEVAAALRVTADRYGDAESRAATR